MEQISLIGSQSNGAYQIDPSKIREEIETAIRTCSKH